MVYSFRDLTSFWKPVGSQEAKLYQRQIDARDREIDKLFDNAASSGLLADFGYDADKLTAERGKIEAFDAANRAQKPPRVRLNRPQPIKTLRLPR